MKYTIELEQYGIRISYSREDGCPAKRNAILIMKAIEDAGERAACLAGYEIALTNAPKRTGEYSVAVDGKQITATAGGILTYQLIRAYFTKLLEEGKAPFDATGTVAESYDDSNQYAFDKQGKHRVMFYNVLWDNDALHAGGERNILATHIVREFLPSVVGFQECGKPKRADCRNLDMAKLMTAAGYVETPVAVKNDYHDVNCVPLFYDPELVEYLDGAYLWYSLQCQRENVSRMDRSSKSLTWGLFADKATEDRYIIANTHMCTQDDDIREEQVKEACALFEELKAKYGVPIILGGDFNSLPSHKGYRYYRDVMGFASARNEAKLHSCDTKTHHPYPEMDWELGMIMPTAGAELHAYEKCVDHIVYPSVPESFETYVFGVAVNDFSLACSDHFPMFIDFDF